MVASGDGLPSRAAAISWAVRRAVPLGASTLFGWCSSTISTESKYRRGLRGEPHHQHGADAEVRCDHDTQVGMSAQPAPDGLGEPLVVETGRADDDSAARVDAPAQVVHHGGGGREVDDDVRVAQRVAIIADIDPGHQLEIRRRPRPPAHLRAHPPARRRARRPFMPRTPGSSSYGPITASDSGRAEQLGRQLLGVVEGHGVDAGEDLLDGHQLAVDQLGLAQPAHPRPGVLEAEHQAATHLTLASLELLGAEPGRGHERELLPAELDHLRRPIADGSRRRRRTVPVSA